MNLWASFSKQLLLMDVPALANTQRFPSALCGHSIQSRRPFTSDGRSEWMVRGSQGSTCCQCVLIKSVDQNNLTLAEQHFCSNTLNFNRDAKFTIKKKNWTNRNIKSMIEKKNSWKVWKHRCHLDLIWDLITQSLNLKKIITTNIYANNPQNKSLMIWKPSLTTTTTILENNIGQRQRIHKNKQAG